MTHKTTSKSNAAFEKMLPGADKSRYLLRLYVTGATPRSARAIANVKQICDEYLPGAYRLDIIDLYQQPDLARTQDIVAAPTLIKEQPLPVRRVLGDMSMTERVLAGLGLLH